MGCVPEDIELPCRIKSVATDTALSISAHRARLSGKVDITDTDSISCGIIYDVSSTLSSTKGTMKSTRSVGDYFVEVSELKANTTYYYRAYAVEAETYKYGKIHSFKTDISVVTGTAKDVTHNAATLSGEIDSDGKSLTCGIIYGTSSVLSDTNGTKVSTTSKGKYVINIADLSANTTYYYCAYAIIGNTYKYGKVLSFKTGVSVVTGEATDISESGATLAGMVEGNNNAFDCGMIYATSSAALLSSGTKIAATSKDEHYSITLADLSANTTYYYCAYAVVNGQYVYGEVKSLTTLKVLSVITGAASNIGTNKATVSCVVYGASESITCGVIYGTTNQLSSTSGSRASTTSKGSYSINLESLKENTTYYYRAYIVVNKEYRYGDIRSFTTSQTSQPSQSVSVTTDAASDITNKSASLNGTLEGSTSSVACGFIYGKTTTLSSTSGTKVSTSSSGAYSILVSGLEDNTTYYYRAYALINGQYIYGTVRSFTTKREITITTNEASDITSHGAVLSGTINNAEQSMDCGIIYGTSNNLSSTSGTKLSTTSQGTFSFNLADLTPNTTYYYCAYAIVEGEYKYGEILSFNTEQEDKTSTVGEAIDLGLSVKWASWNVGASSPEEYGDYFAWGETVTKSIYYDGNSVIYGFSISELESRGIISSDGNLTAEYDAATANWSGSWRMPTKAEQVELLANCTWEWTTQNGVNGYKVTGVNGNFIFLPAAGYRPGTSLYDADSYGIYWSATLYDNSAYACDLSFDSSEYGWHRSYCSFGLTVRPVYSEAPLQVATIETGEAADITTDGVVLHGVVSNATESISCGFIYGTSSDMSSLNNKRIGTSSVGSYSMSVSYLQSGTTYYYCAYAIIGGEERYGEVCSFTTLQEVAITTGEATDITADGATLSGVVTGADEAITCGIIYGTSSDMSLNENREETSSNGTYTISISYLQPGTTYYYCAYAVIDGEEWYGEVRSFTTELFPVKPDFSSHEAVDLGLSVKWASYNVGATSSEEYGDYFAWGETTTKSDYRSSNSVTYGLSISELESRGIIDSDGQLTAVYDAATTNWGESWRMPTKAEQDELRNKCTWTWTTQNGVKGYKVTGPNGNFIFLPAAGYRDFSALYTAGSYGYYWSATPDSHRLYACGLRFDSDGYYWYDYYRYNGFAVRPVSER